eukprot:2165464-Ditylum_brightwellii.AAC.1
MIKISTAKLDPDDPWVSILSAVMLDLQSTIHTTYNDNLVQLVFRRDAMLNVMYLANLAVHTEKLTYIN